jgi:hypothetical protein
MYKFNLKDKYEKAILIKFFHLVILKINLLYLSKNLFLINKNYR